MPGTTSNSISPWPSQPQCCHGAPLNTASAWAPNYKAPGPQSVGPPTTSSSVHGLRPVSSMLGLETLMWTTSVGRGLKTWPQAGPFIRSQPAIPAPMLRRRQRRHWQQPPWFSRRWTPLTQGCFWPLQRRSCNLQSSTEGPIVTLLDPQFALFTAPILDTR